MGHNEPIFTCRRSGLTRRRALTSGLGAAAAAWSGIPALAAPAPTSPVSVAKCSDYGPALLPTMRTMFDQIGGLGKLVKGKTVALKVNMTGSPDTRINTVPAEFAQYTHPAVIGATIRLMSDAGARRIRVIEGCFVSGEPLEEFMYRSGWDPMSLINAGSHVDMENTNILGKDKRYHRLMARNGGYIYPGFDFNHSAQECDVMVSIAKLKEHATCGITLAMKNMFGLTPITIYGDHAGKDEPATEARGGRGSIMHQGVRGPSKSAPQEINPMTPRNQFYRMPRIVVDVCDARPIDLSIIDGVYSMAGGEGPWNGRVWPVKPGVLVAGLNMVCTDSVATALMGFDPMAARGKAPFERCDNTLELAEAKGLGTRDLKRIEVVGTPIREAVFDFRKSRRA